MWCRVVRACLVKRTRRERGATGGPTQTDIRGSVSQPVQGADRSAIREGAEAYVETPGERRSRPLLPHMGG
eukprot:15436254-Alexandrium_andersonii.AAC.1